MSKEEATTVPPPADAESGKKKRGRKPKRPEPKFPVEPRVIQIVNKPKSYMNHSYRDFSMVPAEIGYVRPTKIEDMTFAQKVHHILSQPEYQKWITWLPHGRAFKILVPKLLEQSKCLLKYFGHNRYSSFLRQLNNFGFKHISQGPDRNSYYHEFMLRGLPHLAKYMPEGKDARRLVPDPDNEPDFYSISRVFPLPDKEKQPEATSPATTPTTSAGIKRLASNISFSGDELPPAKRAALVTTPVRPEMDVATQARQLLASSTTDMTMQALAATLQAELLALQQKQQIQQAAQNPALAALAAFLHGGAAGKPFGF